jgi:predicted Zn-dependent protease
MKRSLLISLLGFAAAAVGCGSPARLTESQEYFVGRGVAAGSILQTQGLIPDEALGNYVNLVGQTLALESDRPETYKGYHFGVLRSEEVNAFAAPGGFVFVTTGALKLMENEDELAGVLAHEVAHVNLRHPEEHANNSTQKSGAMDVLAAGGHLSETGGQIGGAVLSFLGKQRAADTVKSVGENLARVVKAFSGAIDEFLQEIMVNGYGREAELAADGLGVDILCRSGVRYDPGGLRAFISRLPKKERGAWATHPDLEGRLQSIEEQIRKRGVQALTDPARTTRFKAATAGLRGT